MNKITSTYNTCNNKNSRIFSLLLYLVLFIFVVALYSKTISYGISGIDDDIFSNYTFKDYSVKDIFTKNVFLDYSSKGAYRPLLSLSFCIDNLIYQSPTTMHITNILLHAICAILFMFFLRYYFDTKISLLLSFLFAAHSLCIFTVAWIPGRNDSLLCIFFLLSLIFFIEYLKQDKKIFFFFNLIFFIFSLITKESSVILPFVFICFWFIYNKNFNKKFVILVSAYSFILVSFITMYTIFFLSIFKVIKAFPYWITNFLEIFDYFTTMYFFNIHFSSYFGNTIIILGIISILLHFLFSCFSGLTKKEKILFFILPIILIGETLVIGKVFFQGNRAYLSLLFVLIPFCSFITKYLNKKFVYVLLIILVVFSINMTIKKQQVFTNDLSLFEAIDKEKENSNIFFAINYSFFLLRDGYWQEASVKAKDIEKKLKERNEENILNLYILAVVCMYEERFDEATKLFEKVISFDKKEFSLWLSDLKIDMNNIYAKMFLCLESLKNDERKDYYYNLLLNIYNNDNKAANELIEKERNIFRLNK